jgi:hypothetical protein
LRIEQLFNRIPDTLSQQTKKKIKYKAILRNYWQKKAVAVLGLMCQTLRGFYFEN